MCLTLLSKYFKLYCNTLRIYIFFLKSKRNKRDLLLKNQIDDQWNSKICPINTKGKRKKE